MMVKLKDGRWIRSELVLGVRVRGGMSVTAAAYSGDVRLSRPNVVIDLTNSEILFTFETLEQAQKYAEELVSMLNAVNP